MAQETNSYFRNKKATVSFILSLFVFFIHFCSFSVFLQADGMLKRVFDTLLHVARVAVPLFFMISAAMFFRNYTLRDTAKSWNGVFLACAFLTWCGIPFGSYWVCWDIIRPLARLQGVWKFRYHWKTYFAAFFCTGSLSRFGLCCSWLSWQYFAPLFIFL